MNDTNEPRPTLKHFLDSRWFKSRPGPVQEAARRYPPGLYRMTSTGQKVVLYAYEEQDDGSVYSCKVNVTKEFNPGCTFERQVFGVPLADLEPVDILV